MLLEQEKALGELRSTIEGYEGAGIGDRPTR